MYKIIATKNQSVNSSFYSEDTINWAGLSDIRHSEDGLTGVFFLFFEGNTNKSKPKAIAIIVSSNAGRNPCKRYDRLIQHRGVFQPS